MRAFFGHRRPIAAVAPESEVGSAFFDLAGKVEELAPKKKFSKGLKLL